MKITNGGEYSSIMDAMDRRARELKNESKNTSGDKKAPARSLKADTVQFNELVALNRMSSTISTESLDDAKNLLLDVKNSLSGNEGAEVLRSSRLNKENIYRLIQD